MGVSSGRRVFQTPECKTQFTLSLVVDPSKRVISWHVKDEKAESLGKSHQEIYPDRREMIFRPEEITAVEKAIEDKFFPFRNMMKEMECKGDALLQLIRLGSEKVRLGSGR